MQIKIKNLSLNYEIFGNKGKSLILLHGWGGSLESLRKLGELLNKEGFNIYLVDLPGFGSSEKPSKEGFCIDEYAEIIEEFIKSQNIKNPILFGHSFGGAIGIKITARKNIELEKLILCNASGIRNPESFKLKMFKTVSKLLKFITKNPKVRKLIYYYILRQRDYIDHQDLAETFKKVVAEDLTSILSKVDIPTLLLWGELDRSTPLKHAKIMNENIKSSELKVYSEIGHGLPKFQPERIVEDIIKFVKI